MITVINRPAYLLHDREIKDGKLILDICQVGVSGSIASLAVPLAEVEQISLNQMAALIQAKLSVMELNGLQVQLERVKKEIKALLNK